MRHFLAQHKSDSQISDCDLRVHRSSVAPTRISVPNTQDFSESGVCHEGLFRANGGTLLIVH